MKGEQTDNLMSRGGKRTRTSLAGKKETRVALDFPSVTIATNHFIPPPPLVL